MKDKNERKDEASSQVASNNTGGENGLPPSSGSDQILEYHGGCFTVNIPQWHFGSKLGIKMSKADLVKLQAQIVEYLSND